MRTVRSSSTRWHHAVAKTKTQQRGACHGMRHLVRELASVQSARGRSDSLGTADLTCLSDQTTSGPQV